MKSKLMLVCAILLGALLTAGSAWAQVSVPHTFSAGTAAKASEVNANFDALASAINAIGGGGLTAVSGYGTPYAATDAIGSRNVIVLRRGVSTVNLAYFVIVYYSGTASSQIAVDGTTPLTFAYIEEYITVQMGIDDTTILSAGGVRRGSDDAPGSTVRTWYSEGASWDPTTGAPNAPTFASPAKFQRIRNATNYLNVFNPDVEVDYPLSTSTEPDRIRDHSRTFIASPTALNINGIPFADTVVLLEFGTTRKFILAKNIGIVWWDLQGSTIGADPTTINKVVFYRVNGSSAGSLAGTPFESGVGLLDAIF